MVLPGRLSPGDMYPSGERGVSQRFIALATGLRIRLVEAGAQGAPPVVFVPGWGCGAWIFHFALSAFRDAGFRAIAVELKGHGLSDKPVDPDEYSVESMRDHLVGILDALALPAANLVGHSMGGSLVAHVAASAPDRVTALALVAPVGFTGAAGMRVFRALTPQFIVPVLPYIASRTVVRMMLKIAHGALEKPTQRDIDEFRAPTQFPGFTRALRHLLHRYDWNAEFPRLAVPRLVLVGEKDHLSRAKDAARFSGTRDPVVIAGAGHALFGEAPELVNTVLIDFFRAPNVPGYISRST